MRRALLLGGWIGSGALTALAFPALGAWPLILVGLAPLLVSMARSAPSAAALAGLAWGVGFFGCLLSWLYRFFRHYGSLPAPLSLATLALLVGYLSIYPGLFSYLGARWLARFPQLALLLLPSLWVSLEFVRGRAFSGFPWGAAGYPLADSLPLAQVASITGLSGLSFLAVLSNVVIARWISRASRRERPIRLADLGCLALFVSLFGWGFRALQSSPGPGEPLRAAVIQASVPQDEKWSSEAALSILKRHEEMTREAAGAGAALVLWSESSSPYPLSAPAASAPGGVRPNLAYRERLESLAREEGVSLLFGAVDYRPSREGARPVNAAALIRSDGSWGETYAKMHLVPFGEYVPLSRILGFVNRVAGGAIGDFLPGRAPVVVRVPPARLGTLICYEMVFPELVRRFAASGASVLANLTNDAWFGTSAGPHQHFQMARLRAVENRRYILRAANTGISAVVDPAGRVVERTRLLESRVLVQTVTTQRAKSFYTRHGDVLSILCAILAAAALAADLARRRSGPPELNTP